MPCLTKIVSVGFILIPLFLSGSEFQGKKDPSKVLREIYKEVKELGKFPGDDFIKREFFVGKDDDDTYQDIHALILIQNIDEIEKITIQVTYFQPNENDPTVKYAKNMKSISYALLQDEMVILKSDYDEKERKKFLPQILRAIRGKKKLLKKTILLT
ncbi:MAG: hypothetical protein JSV17_16915 [Candidatus Aminicenantes bacterium]|nr:MAG: hypothetical protein JSV17_16915 [Candidatus Aminicenantes bacterium]